MRFKFNVVIFVPFGRAELQKSFIKAKHHNRLRKGARRISSPSDDATVTRRQALEIFGIDLGTMGTMTKARINVLQSGTPETHSITSNPLGTSNIDRVENNPHSSGDIGKSKARCRKKRGSGGNITNEPAASDKRQETISSRLKFLDSLISEGSLGTPEESGNIRSPHDGHASEGSTPASADSASGVGSSPASLENVRKKVRNSNKSLRSNVPSIPAIENLLVSDIVPR